MRGTRALKPIFQDAKAQNLLSVPHLLETENTSHPAIKFGRMTGDSTCAEKPFQEILLLEHIGFKFFFFASLELLMQSFLHYFFKRIFFLLMNISCVPPPPSVPSCPAPHKYSPTPSKERMPQDLLEDFCYF